MYAVIDAGGKQERVEVGQLVDVDLLRAAPGDELTLEALLVVDGAQVAATPEALAGSTVSARVVGEALGPKIVGFTYKKKTRSRRRFGHRQRYTTVEITGIAAGDAAGFAPAPEPQPEVEEAPVGEWVADAPAVDEPVGEAPAGEEPVAEAPAVEEDSSSTAS